MDHFTKNTMPLQQNSSALSHTSFGFNPSGEQEEIMRAALMGSDIKVQAFAGTGKTTTIKLLSNIILKRSQYIAFNKFIVDDVKSELPDHVKASTAHSMAYADIVAKSVGYTRKFSEWEKLWWPSTVKEFSNNLLSSKLAPMVARLVKRFLQSIDEVITEDHLSTADLNTIVKWTESENDQVIRLTLEFCQQNLDSTPEEISSEISALYPYAIKSSQSEKNQQSKLLKLFFSQKQFKKLVSEVLKNFKNYSPSEQVTIEDFPAKELKRIEFIGKPSCGQKNNKKDLLNKVVNIANVFWDNIKNQESHCPVDFDCYLKLWQLSKPTINADVIYIDEAQDLDPVMLDVLLNQQRQTIWLGDKYQQIYAWRGAVNALDTVKNCTEYRLTQTYRFPESIASVANLALKKLGEERQIKTKIKGKERSVKRVNDRTAYISRTNRALFSQALILADRGQYFHYADNNFKPSTIMKHCRSICELSHGKDPYMDVYQEFDDIHELKEFVKADQSSSIAMPYDLCEQFKFNYEKIQKVIEIIQSFNRVNSLLILTTAHRSKGQEWEEVILLDDFETFIVREKAQGTMHEWNLLYVAMTRAKNKLTIGNEIKRLLGLEVEKELPKSIIENQTPNTSNSGIRYDKSNNIALHTKKITELNNRPQNLSANKSATSNNEQLIYSDYIAGVSHQNIDGTSRQEILRNTEVNSRLKLIHDKYNQYDPNAIKVEFRGQTLGYISKTDTFKFHQYGLNNLKTKLISLGQSDRGLLGGKIQVWIGKNNKLRKNSLNENIIEREQVSSHSVATLLHQWGLVPRVQNESQIDFTYNNYEFSCVIVDDTILLSFGDIIFKLHGSTRLDEVQSEVGSLNKRIENNFGCLTAFKTKKNEVGLEITYNLPIISCLVTDHLHLTLNNYLSCSLSVLTLFNKLGYRTVSNNLLAVRRSDDLSDYNILTNKPTLDKQLIPKKERCLSCEGNGKYSAGNTCSMCHGSGVRSEITGLKNKKAKDEYNSGLFQNKTKATSDYRAGYSYEDGYSDGESYADQGAMLDNDMSDYSAEMGNDGDD